MATQTGNGGQVTITVTPTVTATSGATTTVNPVETDSTTLSLIYIYSASTVAEPTVAAKASEPSREISGGAIAGIVVGSVAFLVILAFALFCYSRNVARRRRAEFASLHPSRYDASSRAYSRATTSQPMTRPRASPYALSGADQSSATVTSPVRINSPADIKPAVLPQELPTPHNRLGPNSPVSSKDLRVAHLQPRKKRTEASEVHGSHAYPAELPVGSQADLVGAIQEMKQAKLARGSRRGTARYSESSGSEGYMSPRWPQPPGTVSDMDTITDAEEAAYGDLPDEERSIHIYYRPGSGWDTGSSPLSMRQSRIAAALSQASATERPSRRTMSSGTTPMR